MNEEIKMIEFISSEVYTEEDNLEYSDSLNYCFYNYGFQKAKLSLLQLHFKEAWESEKTKEEEAYTIFMPETNTLIQELKNKINEQCSITENAKRIINNIKISCDQVLLQEEEKQYSFSPAENAVMAKFPQFKNDYQTLINNGYMSRNNDYLIWNKSKQSLAEYFGYKINNNTNIPWKVIETLFNKNNLSSSFSRNGNAYKNISRDYEQLKNIIK